VPPHGAALDSPEDVMLLMKPAALAAALVLGALALGGCHDGGHHYRHHDRHGYRYDRDWREDDGWHGRGGGGGHYRHRDYGHHGEWHDAGYYRRGRHHR
jgi:hypothetical protein